jgi:hypothetical protein
MSAKKDATPLQVAAVVSFYMGAALVVSTPPMSYSQAVLKSYRSQMVFV